MALRFVAFRVEFDEAMAEQADASALPSDWTAEPPPPAAQAVGGLWVRQSRSAVLALPSVIICVEANYLLNPGHPDFPRIAIGPPEPFSFDPRLL